jgi:DNA invertase Pin-like site-specific DNA recombinase
MHWVCSWHNVDVARRPLLLKRAKAEGKMLGRPRIAPELEARILAALKAPGRTEGVRKIAARFGISAKTVQRISRPPFDAVAA